MVPAVPPPRDQPGPSLTHILAQLLTLVDALRAKPVKRTLKKSQTDSALERPERFGNRLLSFLLFARQRGQQHGLRRPVGGLIPGRLGSLQRLQGRLKLGAAVER